MTIAQQKIKLALESSDLSEFRFTDCTFGGDECVLVNSVAFPKWTQKNKYLRSLIYRKSDFLPISSGFPKFVNLGESPIEFPPLKTLDGCTVVEKIDGSLLIISNYKGQLIIRTRGSTGFENCLNKHEIDLFKSKYSELFNLIYQSNSEGTSFLFEWCSPLNKIVIDYGIDPSLTLIGLIGHTDLNLYKQEVVQQYGKLVNISTPKTYTFDTLENLLVTIKKLRNQEGACLYSNDGQDIFKAKSDDYLIKHRFKEKLNYESMVDYFILNKDITIEEQIDKIGKEIDFECATQAKVFLLDIDKKYKNILKTFEDIKSQVSNYKDKPRKELALFVKQSYNGPFQGIAFSFFEGKSVDDKKLTQLLND